MLQKVLQMVMEKVVAAVPAHDPSFLPGPTHPIDIDEPYAFFPSLPRIREPRNYDADDPRQQNQRRNAEEVCNKKAYKHGTLSRGGLVQRCTCNKAVYLTA